MFAYMICDVTNSNKCRVIVLLCLTQCKMDKKLYPSPKPPGPQLTHEL